MSPPPQKTAKQTKASHRKSRQGCRQCKALRNLITEAGFTVPSSQAAVSSSDEAPITVLSHDHSLGPLFGLWSQSYHLDAHCLEDSSALFGLEDTTLNGFLLPSEGPDWMSVPLQGRVEETPQDSNPIPIGDDASDMLRDGPINSSSAEDVSQDQIISIPESSRLREIHHVSSSLSTYFFQDVLPRYCTWDSNSSIIRIIIQAMWQSSGALHHTMQSMAASCLSNEIPYFSKIAAQERTLALECVQETPMREDRLLTAFLLGHTSCWVNPTDLVPNQFNEIWATLQSYTSSTGTTSVISFVQEALEYWTMVLSFITDTEQLGNSAAGLPRTSGPLPLNSFITPNPFSGVTRGAVSIFTDTSRLIYKLRKRLPHLRFIRDADVNFLRDTLNEAHRLENRILEYSPLDASTIVVLGDPHTTPEHFKILDEVFWYTSLLQLYRVFPDLLIQRYQPWNPQRILQPEAPSHVPSRDETDEWLMKLALHILGMLQGIPLDSRTRSIQAPIIVALSSELRHKSPDASELDSASEAGDLRAMPPSIISHSIEIARARRFVMSRLSIYWHVLPLQKVKKYQVLVEHIWEALDAGVPDVYWADMLRNKQLRTVMG
ncbi:c6 zinc finger domain protein [Fusarium flagelliforme]|uniref:C6 zinc finger domain protein n=1 Tax=Fusarium flagelliforme TaxID=2675880 RepID=A0A395MFE1_9HYPO|nr:c6 zinc finger domain protein [Fusarium flagelliforme]